MRKVTVSIILFELLKDRFMKKRKINMKGEEESGERQKGN